MGSVLVTKQKRNWHVLSTKNLDEISTLFYIFRLLRFSVTKNQGFWQHKNLEVKRFKIKYAIRLHKQQRISKSALDWNMPHENHSDILHKRQDFQNIRHALQPKFWNLNCTN